ncbi:MAG TPA: hypothetical protein PLV68_12815, partial [Ilumatobacteraceae bacterium]|nr:hypothetical protein [Ilumatobacteraceae bacterium]
MTDEATPAEHPSGYHLAHQYLAAAFFDLDRTLISGSSAFVFGIAAWRADMLPSRQFVKDAAGALAF